MARTIICMTVAFVATSSSAAGLDRRGSPSGDPPIFPGSKVSAERGRFLGINATTGNSRIRVAVDSDRQRVVVTDSVGAMVDPQRGDRGECHQVSRTTVSCRHIAQGILGAFLGSGADRLIIESSYRDKVVGSAGAGDDVVAVSANRQTRLVFNGSGGNDQLLGGSGFDWLDGGSGLDELRGKEGADTVIGAGGPDVLSAGVGRDRVNAEDGTPDRLIDCGFGRDTFASDGSTDPPRKGCEKIGSVPPPSP